MAQVKPQKVSQNLTNKTTVNTYFINTVECLLAGEDICH